MHASLTIFVNVYKLECWKWKCIVLPTKIGSSTTFSGMFLPVLYFKFENVTVKSSHNQKSVHSAVGITMNDINKVGADSGISVFFK